PILEFAEVIRKRRMVRNFTSQAVEPEQVEQIVAAALRAPSAGNTQGQSLIVVTDPKLRLEVAACCGEEHYTSGGFHPFVSGAPVQIVVCTNEMDYHRRYQEGDKVQDDGSEIE